MRGGTERNAAAALRDCVLEVRESGNLRWTLVLRSPHHKPPFELHRNRDDDIDWEGDPPPVRPLFLRKCSLTPKPGATHTLDTLPADPTVMSDGKGYEFPFDLKGRKPFRLKVVLKTLADAVRVLSEAEPSIADTNKDLKPLSAEYEKNKKSLAEGLQFLIP